MFRSLRLAKYALLLTDLLFFIAAYQLGHLMRLGRFYPQIVIPGTAWFLPLIIITFVVFDLYNPLSHVSRLGLATRSFPALGVLAIALSLVAFLAFGDELQRYAGRGVLYLALLVYTLYVVTGRFAFSRIFNEEALRNRWLVLAERSLLDPIRREMQRRFSNWEIVYLVNGQVGNGPKEDQSVVLPLKRALKSELKKDWDGILLAAEQLTDSEVELILRRRMSGVDVLDLTSFYERYFYKVPLFYFQKAWFSTGRGFLVLSNPIGLRFKVLTDYTAAALLLLLTWPLMILVALAVWMDSGLPIFFRQERQGHEGRRFHVFKFRTMVNGADRLNPYTAVGDARITRIGRLLRLTRMDELPQLFNILMGQMSLIGPRAEWTKLTERYEAEIPFYELRHLVRPGLTGWAQVMYPYGANIEDTIHKLEYDLYYIKNYTALLDLNILMKTIRVVLFGRGR